MTDPTPAKAENVVLAERVFDMLMEKIEPELLLKNVSSLDSKYAGETPEEHEARMNRYAAAYALFDTELEKFMSGIHQSVHVNKRTALRAAEAQDKTQEQNVLNSLASAFA